MNKILDQFGNPIDMSLIGEPQSEVANDEARTGWLAREFDNHPGRGLTPARLNAIFQAAEQGDLIRQLELADDMEERSGHIYAELHKRKTAVTNLDWEIKPPKNASPEEKKMTEAVSEWLESVDDFEEDVLLELLDGILKGFKGIEMWWTYEDKLMVPRFASRPQRWLCLNEMRTALNLRDASAYGQPLRPYNWLLHQPRSRSGYPARTGICRVLALPFLYENYSTRDLAEFLEIYGLPLRLGKFPTGSTDAEKRKLLQAVVNIGHNAAGIIPMGMEIDFENAAQGNEKPFQTMIHTMQAIESKVILGQTLTASEGQHGTQALGNVHEGVRQDIKKSDAKRLSSTITQQLIRPFCLLNFSGADPRRLPKFELDVPDAEDLALFADAYPKLAAAGLEIDIEDVHRTLRIPRAKTGAVLMRGPTAAVATAPADQVPPGGPAQNGSPKAGPDKLPPKPEPGAKTAAKPAGAAQAALAGQLSGAPDQVAQGDILDDLVQDAVQDWRPVMEPMVAPLLAELDAAVARGETLDQFRARLPELLEQMDSRPQAERLARAAFLARLAGEADLSLGE
jgi:phage gp29-like protein